MADTISWGIANLERQLANGEVYTVHYTVNAVRTTAEGDTYTAGSYGSIGLDAAAQDDFVPFEQLTEETVIGWTKEKLGAETVTSIESALTEQLDKEQAPTTAAGVPW